MLIRFDVLRAPKQRLILYLENPYTRYEPQYWDYRAGFIAGANNQEYPKDATKAKLIGFLDGDAWYSKVNRLATLPGY